MASLQKKMKKEAKKLGNKLCGKKSLTLRHTYSFTTSLYGNNKKKKPYFSVSMQGDCKISLFRLVMILLAVGSAAALIILAVRALLEKIRRNRLAAEEDFTGDAPCSDEYDSEEELPF